MPAESWRERKYLLSYITIGRRPREVNHMLYHWNNAINKTVLTARLVILNNADNGIQLLILIGRLWFCRRLLIRGQSLLVFSCWSLTNELKSIYLFICIDVHLLYMLWLIIFLLTNWTISSRFRIRTVLYVNHNIVKNIDFFIQCIYNN